MPGNQKLPIYHATKSLDVRYRFQSKTENAVVTVKGAKTHAMLYAGCQGLLATREEKSDVSKINFATVSITFLSTDTTAEEGYLGEQIDQWNFPLVVSNATDRIWAAGDLYPATSNYQEPTVLSNPKAANKAGRNYDFNQLLEQRLGPFAAIAANYELPYGTISTVAGIRAQIADTQFHETYHHSEQVAMHYSSSPTGIRSLVNYATTTHAKYLYGVIVDIYTQRTLCKNCNACLIGMGNTQQQGFLFEFNAALERQRIETRPTGLMFAARVSASKASRGANLDPLRLPTDAAVVHEFNPNLRNPVLQAENVALGTQSIITEEKYNLSSYRGAFFVSTQFPNKKLEKKLAALPPPAPTPPKIKLKIMNPERRIFSAEEKIMAGQVKDQCKAVGLTDVKNIIEPILEFCGLPKLTQG